MAHQRDQVDRCEHVVSSVVGPRCRPAVRPAATGQHQRADEHPGRSRSGRQLSRSRVGPSKRTAHFSMDTTRPGEQVPLADCSTATIVMPSAFNVRTTSRLARTPAGGDRPAGAGSSISRTGPQQERHPRAQAAAARRPTGPQRLRSSLPDPGTAGRPRPCLSAVLGILAERPRGQTEVIRDAERREDRLAARHGTPPYGRSARERPALIRCPSSVIEPDDAASPAIARRSWTLPAPFVPRSATTSTTAPHVEVDVEEHLQLPVTSTPAVGRIGPGVWGSGA